MPRMKANYGKRKQTYEPQPEEDDTYYIHRKEALDNTRSAKQHSKKASDAYKRGDHVSAKQLSAKAKEERTAAERLNAKAAGEILRIKNKKNDLWEIDLHGLHALEAVQALQERLQKLESLSPNKRYSKKRTGGTADLDGNHRESSSVQKKRAMSLTVITGVGKHSRGEPVLPTAIRTFLNENDYRYEEARPGVISVRPKFRQRRALEKLVSYAASIWKKITKTFFGGP